MNDLSVWWHIGFVAAIAIALFAVGTQPTHDIGFLFQVAPGDDGDGDAVGEIIPFGIAGAFAPEPAPVAVDVYRLRRVGPRRRGDRVRAGAPRRGACSYRWRCPRSPATSSSWR